MNLYLIGYRGSGKSTVGKQVAAALDWPFIDTDDLIEQQAGKSIREIFADVGESGFRRLELEVLKMHTLGAVENCDTQGASDAGNGVGAGGGIGVGQIVSLGGGAILSPENRTWLAATGKVVWLRAHPTTLWRRIQRDQSSTDRRPALTNLSGLAEVEQVLGQRQPIYLGCADWTIDVDQLSTKQIADRIVQWWRPIDSVHCTD